MSQKKEEKGTCKWCQGTGICPICKGTGVSQGFEFQYRGDYSPTNPSLVPSSSKFMKSSFKCDFCKGSGKCICNLPFAVQKSPSPYPTVAGLRDKMLRELKEMKEKLVSAESKQVESLAYEKSRGKEVCILCNGSGKCSACNGIGFIYDASPTSFLRWPIKCGLCKGSGKCVCSKSNNNQRTAPPPSRSPRPPDLNY